MKLLALGLLVALVPIPDLPEVCLPADIVCINVPGAPASPVPTLPASPSPAPDPSPAPAEPAPEPAPAPARPDTPTTTSKAPATPTGPTPTEVTLTPRPDVTPAGGFVMRHADSPLVQATQATLWVTIITGLVVGAALALVAGVSWIVAQRAERRKVFSRLLPLARRLSGRRRGRW